MHILRIQHTDFHSVKVKQRDIVVQKIKMLYILALVKILEVLVVGGLEDSLPKLVKEVPEEVHHGR